MYLSEGTGGGGSSTKRASDDHAPPPEKPPEPMSKLCPLDDIMLDDTMPWPNLNDPLFDVMEILNFSDLENSLNELLPSQTALNLSETIVEMVDQMEVVVQEEVVNNDIEVVALKNIEVVCDLQEAVFEDEVVRVPHNANTEVVTLDGVVNDEKKGNNDNYNKVVETNIVVNDLNEDTANNEVASINSGGDQLSLKRKRGKEIKAAETIPFSLSPDTSGSAGSEFLLHTITLRPEEDVLGRLLSFSQVKKQAVCVLSAKGTICNVTLLQSFSPGGTVTYQGCFEILSLSGSFLPSKSGSQYSYTGGLSVSLAGPNDRPLGGLVAGLLTAASAVQIIVGTFLVPGQHITPGFRKVYTAPSENVS